MIDPQRSKYFPLYWEMAYAAARMSVAERHQVGAVVVAPTGMISVGWNGMPSGLPNKCETRMIIDPITGKPRGKTDPRVIHAEQNAIDKMTLQGIPTKDCILFVTLSPCMECSKRLTGLGLKAIFYDVLHDCTSGLELLRDMGIPVIQKNSGGFLYDVSHPYQGNTLSG